MLRISRRPKTVSLQNKQQPTDRKHLATGFPRYGCNMMFFQRETALRVKPAHLAVQKAMTKRHKIHLLEQKPHLNHKGNPRRLEDVAGFCEPHYWLLLYVYIIIYYIYIYYNIIIYIYIYIILYYIILYIYYIYIYTIESINHHKPKQTQRFNVTYKPTYLPSSQGLLAKTTSASWHRLGVCRGATTGVR